MRITSIPGFYDSPVGGRGKEEFDRGERGWRVTRWSSAVFWNWGEREG